MKKNLITLAFLITANYCFGQQVAQDSLSRYLADKLLAKHFPDILGKSKVLLFSISDNIFYLLIENKKGVDEYYLKDSTANFTLIKKYKRKSRILKEAFTLSNYHKGYITNVENASIQQGNLSYFVVKDVDGKRYGEYHEAIIVNPPPIRKDIYAFIVNRVISL